MDLNCQSQVEFEERPKKQVDRCILVEFETTKHLASILVWTSLMLPLLVLNVFECYIGVTTQGEKAVFSERKAFVEKLFLHSPIVDSYRSTKGIYRISYLLSSCYTMKTPMLVKLTP